MGDNPLQAVTNRFPQVGENHITEAPEVVFDLTQETRAWKPLPPMTS